MPSAIVSLPVSEPPGSVLRAVVQLLMVATSWLIIIVTHTLLEQLLNPGTETVPLMKKLQASSTSVMDLFTAIWETAPAKAMALPVRTVKMVENRMVKRFEKVD